MTASGSLIACRTEYAITTCRSSCHAAGLIISGRRLADLKGTRSSQRQRLNRHQHEERLENHLRLWPIANTQPRNHPDKTTSKKKLAGIQTLLQKFMRSGWIAQKQ